MKRISFLVLVFLLNGCIYQTIEKKQEHENSSDLTNFSLIADRTVQSMDKTLSALPKDNIYVTDFVNLEDLSNRVKLGYILSQELKVALVQKYEFNIHEIEFTKSLSIGAGGTSVLARDAFRLKHNSILQDSYVIVGNYIATTDRLIMYVKIIDFKSGKIIDSAKVTSMLNKEVFDLANE